MTRIDAVKIIENILENKHLSIGIVELFEHEKEALQIALNNLKQTIKLDELMANNLEKYMEKYYDSRKTSTKRDS